MKHIFAALAQNPKDFVIVAKDYIETGIGTHCYHVSATSCKVHIYDDCVELHSATSRKGHYNAIVIPYREIINISYGVEK